MPHNPRPSGRAATQPPATSLVTSTGREVVIELEARECEWEIAPGKVVAGWGYNGLVPGPAIEAEVGDTLVARLKNSLSEPTTIHWHGLRLPAPMDGTDLTQRPVEPGETFEYRFLLPDAGTFWYHPHSNETVQLERGLYGALIVRGPDEPVLDRERVLVLDDLRLDWRGRIAPPGGWLERHNGREGKVRLINGRSDPVLEMAARQTERWRIVNVSNARYVRLSIGGRMFCILGTDGGLLEAPVPATEVLLAPGDRFDLAVGPFEEGETVLLEALPYNRGVRQKKPLRWGTIRVGAPAPSVAAIPLKLRTIERLVSGEANPTREVHLGGRSSWKRGVDFLVNEETHHHDRPVKVGELQVWDVFNDTMMDHPFHLHGFFFQVVEENGAPPPYRSWEDTINVPAHGKVRIAWMPDDRPGAWMYHCHILEHHAAGMMAHFHVER
jgi:FtsP/CotA-like multicopper oxidase with cupredoxin domain